ncbi:hypothetical protein [Rhodohalobacter mucosus]|uniref:Flagellar motility protein MotE (MotC chaperone) n=1 Tax=Rhodohalobacter mucosus TaxID=2079485 RepID=A0A316TKV3_9BACT|nr:hypothetical protein [Rhodohalobacter mucosus]PWN05177.1 hypothetical protein DDZ15_15750 [Rhodohalobacter mucosus]
MDIKKIALYAGGFIASFVVMIALIYFLYPYIDSERVAEVKEQIEMQVKEPTASPNVSPAQTGTSSTQGSSSVRERMEALAAAERQKREYEATIDSLKSEMERMAEEYRVSLENQAAGVADEEVENTTKTLLNLDEETLAPIANRLDHSELMKLYRAASNMQREKLLSALEPEKASEILKEALL